MSLFNPTTIKVLDIDFNGPYLNTGPLLDYSGVYVILTKNHVPGSQWTVLDVGESGSVRTRIENHDRAPEWSRYSVGQLGVATFYTNGWQYSDRLKLEQLIRQQYQPPCGTR
jgi:hypothetical protein